MDFQRVLLFVALGFVLLLMWQAWQEDYGTPRQPTEVAQPGPDGAAPPEDVPVVTAEPAMGPAPAAEAVPETSAFRSAQRIRVETDVFVAEIDTIGGDLRQVELPQYPVSARRPDQPFPLLSDTPPHLFVVQSGFASKQADRPEVLTVAPTHNDAYRAERSEYRLGPDEDTLNVDLHWTSPEGVEVIKRYVFQRGSYLVEVQHEVINRSEREWRGSLYQQLQRTPGESGPAFIYTYTGGVYYSPEKRYQKVSFGDMEDERLVRDITGGWAAMIQHYFLAAWVPPADQPHRYYTRALGNERYVIGMHSGEQQVAAGATATFSNRLFVGPKLQDALEAVAPGLELTVDYGLLTFISKPLFWLLDLIHSLVGNWGWAIVILTILIKLVFYKLSETSYRSMAKMRQVQPRLMALKERYGSDRQRMNQALMDLYKKEKINPLGGCLPILVQIPVFIALYWVLLESVELRQADWILWITDLSTRDPYFVLPILMGITMVAQQKLNPAPLDPIQAKVMMILPLVFTVFFAFFPAGLVLYWLVNNTLSIAQQWYITRVVMEPKQA